MSGPRTDQVKELTRGLKLPMPPVAGVHLDIIIETIRIALDELVKEYRSALLEKHEIELNSLLQARLNGIRDVEKLFGQIVACVIRGGESTSYDGKHIENRPDLAIYLTSRHSNFPLLLECKIIDCPNGKGVDLYCIQGIQRFVEGQYGWANTQCLMLAYVRDGSSVERALTPYLRLNLAKTADPLRTEALPEPKNEGSLLSKHGRIFKYIERRHDPPGSISIYHVWIGVPANDRA
jgi:hypothetical protein